MWNRLRSSGRTFDTNSQIKFFSSPSPTAHRAAINDRSLSSSKFSWFALFSAEMAGLLYHFLSGISKDFWSPSKFDENIFQSNSFLSTWPWKRLMTLVPTPCMVLLIVAWQITTKTRAFFWRIFDRNVIYVWLFFVQVQYGPRAIHSRMPLGIRWRYERNYWQERIQVCDELNITSIWSSVLFKLCNCFNCLLIITNFTESNIHCPQLAG